MSATFVKLALLALAVLPSSFVLGAPLSGGNSLFGRQRGTNRGGNRGNNAAAATTTASWCRSKALNGGANVITQPEPSAV